MSTDKSIIIYASAQRSTSALRAQYGPARCRMTFDWVFGLITNEDKHRQLQEMPPREGSFSACGYCPVRCHHVHVPGFYDRRI